MCGFYTLMDVSVHVHCETLQQFLSNSTTVFYINYSAYTTIGFCREYKRGCRRTINVSGVFLMTSDSNNGFVPRVQPAGDRRPTRSRQKQKTRRVPPIPIVHIHDHGRTLARPSDIFPPDFAVMPPIIVHNFQLTYAYVVDAAAASSDWEDRCGCDRIAIFFDGGETELCRICAGIASDPNQ